MIQTQQNCFKTTNWHWSSHDKILPFSEKEDVAAWLQSRLAGLHHQLHLWAEGWKNLTISDANAPGIRVANLTIISENYRTTDLDYSFRKGTNLCRLLVSLFLHGNASLYLWNGRCGCTPNISGGGGSTVWKLQGPPNIYFLDAIASPSSYSCQSVSQSVSDWYFQIWVPLQP